MATLADAFIHNRWANLALIDHCATLDDKLLDATVPGTFGSVRDTLTHIAGAERRYVARLSDAEPGTLSPDGSFPGFETVRSVLDESGQDLIRLAQQGVDGTFRAEFDGSAYDIDKTVVFVQAINHATEHRAHVVTTLSANSVEPIELDSWTWGDQTGALKPIS